MTNKIITLFFNAVKIFYKSIIQPFWKWMVGIVIIWSSYSYGFWQDELNKLDSTIVENIPVYILKIHAFYIWLYNVKLIQFFYGVIHNIAFYCKLPIYLVSLSFIIFFILILYLFFKWLKNKLFALKLFFNPAANSKPSFKELFIDNNSEIEVFQELANMFNKEIDGRDNIIKTLKNEKNKLTHDLNELQNKYNDLNSKYDKLVEIQSKYKDLELDNKNLVNDKLKKDFDKIK